MTNQANKVEDTINGYWWASAPGFLEYHIIRLEPFMDHYYISLMGEDYGSEVDIDNSKVLSHHPHRNLNHYILYELIEKIREPNR